MFKIASRQELLESFRLIDRAQVEIPRELSFPIAVRGYLAWVEPSGHRVHLVFTDSERRQPIGISFKREGAVATGASMMCQWCHSIRAGDQVTLLTASATDTRRVGLHLCRDLDCQERISESPGVDDLPETLSPVQKFRRLQQRMSEFVRRNLL